MNKLKYILLLMFLSVSSCFAENLTKLDKTGLEGRKILTIGSAVHELWAGAEEGAYWKTINTNEEWQKIILSDHSAGLEVRQIVFPYPFDKAYAATSRGLFEIRVQDKSARRIYFSSREPENDCLGVAVNDQDIFVATRGGLFRKLIDAGRWIKCPLEAEGQVNYVFCAGSQVFAAATQGLYSSQDTGKTWMKVFTFAEARENQEHESDSVTEEAEESAEIIHVIIAAKDTASTIFLGTSTGVFVSRDSGISWQRLPLAGLNSRNIKDLKINTKGELFAATKSGVFQLDKDGWILLAPLFDGRSLLVDDNRIFAVAGLDVYMFEIDSRDDLAKTKTEKTKTSGPTIQEVQKMVIAYCDVGNNKIETWKKQARTKAFMPSLSFGYGNNVYGSYNGLFAVGPNDWQVNMSWDLADFIYSSDQTSIDSRERLMVQLRNDVLAEATQLFFERKKLVLELENIGVNSQGFAVKNLRLEELTALLDRLTGGAFSKAL